MVSSLLCLDAISLRLPDCDLREVSVEVAVGEYLAVMGPTGAGKTVLLEIIAGLRRPDRGRVLLRGAELTHTPACGRGLAYLPQDYALFPHMSVADNITYGLVERGLPPPEIEARMRQTARRLGVEHLLSRRPQTLSGGEAQRVALARALVLEAPLLLLDEPLAAVDERTREELIAALQSVREERSMAVVHVSHSFDEALAVADRLCIVQAGRIAQLGSAEEVMRRPNCEAVALFTGCHNVISGEIRAAGPGAEFCAAALRLPLHSDCRGQAQLMIRPEDIRLLPETATGQPTVWAARVLASGERGPVVRARVEVGGIEWSVLCSRHEAQALDLAPGRVVAAQFPPRPHAVSCPPVRPAPDGAGPRTVCAIA